MPTSASQRENRILRISSWKFRCPCNHRPPCAPQIRRKAEFSRFPRGGLDETRMFHAFRMADLMKSRVFLQSAPQIAQKAKFSRFPRGGLDKTRIFCCFCAADLAKHGCFMLSAPQIRRKVKFSHNPRVRLGEKSSSPAFRASDWAKSQVFMLSARQIRRKVECSCNPCDRRHPHLMDFLCSVRHISAVQTAGRPQRAAISQHTWPHCKPPQLSGRCACFLCKNEMWG